MKYADKLVNAIHGIHRLQLDRRRRLQLSWPQVVTKR